MDGVCFTLDLVAVQRFVDRNDINDRVSVAHVYFLQDRTRCLRSSLKACDQRQPYLSVCKCLHEKLGGLTPEPGAILPRKRALRTTCDRARVLVLVLRCDEPTGVDLGALQTILEHLTSASHSGRSLITCALANAGEARRALLGSLTPGSSPSGDML